MSTAKQRAATELRTKHAMASLVGNPEFVCFINIIRQHLDVAVEDACSDTVIASQRASMAAIGEIRAYRSLISVYDEFLSRAVDDAERDQASD